MWSTTGSRNISAPIHRNQSTPVSSQQNSGQQDMFSSATSRFGSGQTGFRYGAQDTAQSSQVPPSSTDDFPPLNRNTNGEIGAERGASLLSSLGFAPQNGGSSTTLPSNRGNGLLNALSAKNRASDAKSPLGKRKPRQCESCLAFLGCN